MAGDTPDFEIVDDLTAQSEATAWAMERLVAGEAPSAVGDALRAEGWGDEPAEGIVGLAMAQTRAERGVPDYQAALAESEKYYRRASSGWLIGMPVWGAIRRLLFSLASSRALQKSRTSKPPESI